MGEITTVGLDLAKRTFHVIGCDVHGKEVKRKMLKRGQMMAQRIQPSVSQPSE